MPPNIKGITVEIGGNTQPLQRALKDLNKDVNITQSELRQVERLLKLDPKNTELLAQKQKLLGDTVGSTKDKLSALTAAKEKADKDMAVGIQVNQSEYRKLQREIISTELKLKDLTSTTEKSEKQMNLFGRNGVLANEVLLNSIDRINNAIGSLGKKLFSLAADAGAYADEVNTIAKQTGLTTEQIQKFQYATEIIDVPLETLTGSMAKLIKNMSTAQKGTGDAAEAFKKLGVRITDNQGQLNDSQQVFDEVIKKLARMENATQRDAYAMQIFGKSAQDLNPLILGGAEALKELGDEAEAAGLILSQTALDDANTFNDMLDKLRATIKAVVSVVGADLANSFAKLLEALSPVIAIAVDFIKILSSIPAPVMIIIGSLLTMIPLVLSVLKAMTTVNQFLTTFNPATLKTTAIILGVVAALIALSAIIAVLTGKGSELRKTMQSIGDSVGQVGSTVNKVNVPRYAAGTGFHPGGGAIITEYGAERLTLPSGAQYVVMPRGTKVDNAGTTAKVMGNTSYYNVTVQAEDLQQVTDVVRLFNNIERVHKSGEVNP